MRGLPLVLKMKERHRFSLLIMSKRLRSKVEASHRSVSELLKEFELSLRIHEFSIICETT